MQSERAIQAEILNVLRQHPQVKAWRNRSAERGRIGRAPHPDRKGAPDIEGIIQGGWSLGIEVKTVTGQPTREQLEWGQHIQAWGGFWCLARSTDDAIDALSAFLREKSGLPAVL